MNASVDTQRPSGFGGHLIAEYLFPGGLRHLVGMISRRLRGRWRTPVTSVRLNDAAATSASEHLRDLAPEALYEALVYQRGQRSFLLQEDRVRYGDRSAVEPYLHQRLVQALGLTSSSSGRLLEFGCGQGRNLFWLKRYAPDLRLHGVDISPGAIRAAMSFGKRLGLDVQFDTLTGHRLPFPDGWFDAAFTKHCLEQCPYTYRDIIQELLRVTRGPLVFLEPLSELYPVSFRGVCGRLHGLYHEYARGVYRYLRRATTVTHHERVGWSANAVNETCLVVVNAPSADATREGFPA